MTATYNMEVSYKQYSMKEAGPNRIYHMVNDSIYIGSKPDKTKLVIVTVRILFTYRKQGVDSDGEGYKELIFGLGVFTFIKLIICALFCIMLLLKT